MEYIQLSEEVKNALDKDKPIIAIETGGTFEGFAYPDNEKVALEVQDAVRKAGAIPAYILFVLRGIRMNTGWGSLR